MEKVWIRNGISAKEEVCIREQGMFINVMKDIFFIYNR